MRDRDRISRADVTFRGETKRTNDAGWTEFSNIPFGGSYQLRVEKNGFDDYSVTVTDADLTRGYINVILHEN